MDLLFLMIGTWMKWTLHLAILLAGGLVAASIIYATKHQAGRYALVLDGGEWARLVCSSLTQKRVEYGFEATMSRNWNGRGSQSPQAENSF